MRTIILCFFLAFVVACQVKPPAEKAPEAQVDGSLNGSENPSEGPGEVIEPAEGESPSVVIERIPLYWEKTTEVHAERESWSDRLAQRIQENLDVLGNAKDIERICPKFDALERNQRVKALGEFFVALAYYESGFNPRSAAVDVGVASNRNTWSIGLFQVSVVDQQWAGNYDYSYEQLLGPHENIDLALTIMTRQVRKGGLFILPNSSSLRYWATLLEGNKYNEISAILARVKKYAPLCY